MSLAFDLNLIRVTEFGVGLDEAMGSVYRLVPVDAGVQEALRDMAQTTWNRLEGTGEDTQQYAPSEKYAATERLFLPIDHPLAARMKELHDAENLALDTAAIREPNRLFCYFARMTDGRGRRLTALRRATQFKGILKTRLIRFVSDAFQIVEDSVFKLDTDFDVLVDPDNVHILRPSGFEFASKLQDAVLAAVPENVRALRRNLAFVEFDTVEAYAGSHPRAARYLASIRSQNTRNISRAALRRLGRQTGVTIAQLDGKLVVPPGQVMGFLEVLDRRRYELELVEGSPERFRAASRQKLNGP